MGPHNREDEIMDGLDKIADRLDKAIELLEAIFASMPACKQARTVQRGTGRIITTNMLAIANADARVRGKHRGRGMNQEEGHAYLEQHPDLKEAAEWATGLNLREKGACASGILVALVHCWMEDKKLAVVFAQGLLGKSNLEQARDLVAWHKRNKPSTTESYKRTVDAIRAFRCGAAFSASKIF